MTDSGKERNDGRVIIYLDGGGNMQRASIPALGIADSGETAKEALETIKRRAGLEAIGILEGRGGPEDDREDIASLILRKIVVREEPFQVVNEPPPVSGRVRLL